MMTLEEIATYLDTTLATRPLKYPDELKAVKDKGYTVLRNSQGKHKVRVKGDMESINNLFGGIFGGMF